MSIFLKWLIFWVICTLWNVVNGCFFDFKYWQILLLVVSIGTAFNSKCLLSFNACLKWWIPRIQNFKVIQTNKKTRKMQWSTTSSQKYGLSVFQISEGSQVKNLSRSATWPDKLVEKLQWIGWSSGNLPIGIPWLHPALKTWTLVCFVRYCAQGSHWLQAAFRIWSSYTEWYKLIKVLLLFLLLGQMLNNTTQTQKNVWLLIALSKYRLSAGCWGKEWFTGCKIWFC